MGREAVAGRLQTPSQSSCRPPSYEQQEDQSCQFPRSHKLTPEQPCPRPCPFWSDDESAHCAAQKSDSRVGLFDPTDSLRAQPCRLNTKASRKPECLPRIVAGAAFPCHPSGSTCPAS